MPDSKSVQFLVENRKLNCQNIFALKPNICRTDLNLKIQIQVNSEEHSLHQLRLAQRDTKMR